MRRRAGVAVLAVVAALGAACGGVQTPAGGVDVDDAVIKLAVTSAAASVGDASVWIDGRYVASVDELRAGVAIDAGTHRFAFERPEYLPAFVEVVVKPAERRTVAVTLYQRLP